MAEAPTDVAEATSESPWQARAVERSLSAARSKALARSAKFLETAVELMNETGGFDFTVQELVDRSELSLRSFYQHFDGKDDLLLALFEEQMTLFVTQLESDLEGLEDPFDRLEALIRHFLTRVKRSPEIGGRALTEFQLRLGVENVASYKRASAPLISLISSIVDDGIKAKVFRTDIDSTASALLINSTLVSIAQMGIFQHHLEGQPLSEDDIVAWCRAAVAGTGAPATSPKRRRTSRS